MFFNLSPYVTWLGIMLTSKPNQLQNHINNINTRLTPPPPTVVTISTTRPPATTAAPVPFICRGRPSGRYPHVMDCSKFYECDGNAEVVWPKRCPTNLHFSPNARVCTLPQDAGCRIPSTTPSTVSSSRPLNTSTTTLSPTGSNWLNEIQRNYYRAVEEDQLVIYYDHDVMSPSSVRWPIPFIRTIWDSVISMYRSFGPNNRLYVLLRGSPGSNESNYATYLDNTKGFLNAIEVGSTNWSVESASNTDIITQNIASIVVNAARGVRYPGREPGWLEIFVYDFYFRALRRTNDSQRWEAKVNSTEHDDISSVPIFSQWYLNLYKNYGEGSILNRYFITRDQYFPKAANNSTVFARAMNRGEFVHFWSGTCGRNLTSLATLVFGWNSMISEQYQQAVQDFSNLTY